MKKIVTLLLLTLSTGLFAQTNSNTIAAFKKSYTSEADKKYADAIKSMQSVYDESSYSINLRLGWLYYLNGDFIKSKSYYNKSIKLNPSSIEARQGLVYPLGALNAWDEVITVYKGILLVNKNHTPTLYQLGYIYFVRKKYSESENYLKQVLTLFPFDYNSNALLGAVYVKMGKINEAKIHYTRALEYNPSSEEIQTILNGL